jgi:hypothetical protein
MYVNKKGLEMVYNIYNGLRHAAVAAWPKPIRVMRSFISYPSPLLFAPWRQAAT